jgi:Carboxypeptidase regulatory-like domain
MPLVRALAIAVTLAFAAAASAATVTGTVTSAVASIPLGGMVVAAYDTSGMLRGNASTDPTGFYSLTLPAGDYRLLAYDPAGVYATSFDGNADSFETTPVRRIADSGAQASFALVKGARVTGRVTTASGTAIPGAVVEAYNLSGTRRGFTTANSSGDYSIVLPPGTYKFIAYDAGGLYAPSFHLGSRTFAGATPVAVTETVPAIVGFNLGIAARVSGTAVDAATHAPLPGVLVFAFTPAGVRVAVTTTNAAGRFLFSLPAGDYRFVAADESHVYATAYFDGSRSFEGSTVVIVAAGEQRELQIPLAHAVRVTGRVNAPNLVVAAYNLDGTQHAMATSDTAGNYTLAVAPGQYKIAFSDPSQGYATLFLGGATDFRFAQTLNVFTDVGGMNVTLPRGGRVSGTARAADGLPLGGIIVAAYDDAGMQIATVTTQSDGRYSMVVPPGTYRFLAFDPQLQYATAHAGGATSYETTGPLSVGADAMITADFTLRRGIRVGGTVTNAKGTPLTGIEVFALDAQGNRAAGATAANGAFTVVVPAGSWRFVALDPFRRYLPGTPSATIAVSEGPTPPTVTLTLAAAVRGRAVRH